MADDESTSAPVDELDDDNDVQLEDIEVSADDIQDSSDEDSESLDDLSDESTDNQADDDETNDESDDESDSQEPTEEEKQAQFRADMFARRQAEKAQRDNTQREQQQAYLAEAQDEQDLALRQLQIDAYENRVERFTNTLTNSYERAVADFEVLRDPNPVIQNRINRAIDAFQAQSVAMDSYGNPTAVSGDLYTYLQEEADTISQLSGIRNQQLKEDKGKQRTKAVTTPRRAPSEPKEDPDIAAFNAEAWS